MTYDSRNGYIYVANLASHSVSVINGTSLLATILLHMTIYFPVYDSDNGYVYVPGDFNSSNVSAVSVINGTKVVASIGVGNGTGWPTYDPADNNIYVPTGNPAVVQVINGLKVIGQVPVGLQPVWTTYDARTHEVYVVNADSDDVSVVDGTTVVGSVAVGSEPDFDIYDPSNGYVYVMNEFSDNVSVIDGTLLVGSVSVGNHPFWTICDDATGFLFVENALSDNVSVINGTRLFATVSVGTDPLGGAYDSGTSYIYICNDDPNSGTVSAIFIGAVVDFIEAGLPAGAGWWINVTGGSTTYSNISNLSVTAQVGSYFFTAQTVDKTYASPAASFTVNGTAVLMVVEVVFSPVVYPVAFTMFGLPTRTNWSMTLAGDTRNSAGNSSTFLEVNGTYPYTLGPLSGYATTNYTGSVVVNGRGVSVDVFWTRVTYTVTLEETGLPIGTGWWLNVTGQASAFSGGVSLTLTEPNGTFSYTASASDKTYSSPAGSFTVNGPLGFAWVHFLRQTYLVVFKEIGLPAGTGWGVTFNESWLPSSRAVTLPVTEINGTYPFVVGSVAGYRSNPNSGTVVVRGANQTIALVFTQTPLATYTVSFSELGLPGASSWLVTLDGTSRNGTGVLVFPALPNGTYRFTVGPVAGYTASPSSGEILVNGTNVAQAIAFARTPTVLGLSPTQGYAAIGGIIAAIAVAAALVTLWRLKRKAPPEPAKTPSRPDTGVPPASP
jgi:YVTN family beta-propeller protein